MLSNLCNAHRNERGFTLIELLVVMIIIGILAAVAIPIFLNQQKTARDTATISDVKNMTTAVQSLMVPYPDATYGVLRDNTVTVAPATGGTPAASSRTTDVDGDGKVALWIGNSATDNQRVEVSISKGTEYALAIYPAPDGGQFIVHGWNPAGKVYTSSVGLAKVSYESDKGKLSK